MPGTEGNPDDYDGIINDLTAEPSAPALSSADTGSLPEALMPSSKGQTQGERLLAGKYKTAQDLEKAHNSLTGEFGKRSQKLKTLESIIQNPNILAAAKNDPALREALAKAGYSLAEAEAEESKASEGDADWDGDETDPRFQIQLLREEMRIDKQRSALEGQLKRPFNVKEWKQIQQVYVAVPGVNVEQAWMLTPAYREFAKASEDKRVQEAISKAQPNRPRPPSPLGPGAKPLDLKKPVSQMNDLEKREYIKEMYRAGQSKDS